MFYYSLYEFAWLLISIGFFSLNDLFVEKFVKSTKIKILYYFIILFTGGYLLEMKLNNK